MRDIVEGAIGDDPEGAVVTTHLATLSSDEGDIDRRDALEDFIGPDAVESGEPREQGDRHVEVVGHAELRSPVTTRKQRR